MTRSLTTKYQNMNLTLELASRHHVDLHSRISMLLGPSSENSDRLSIFIHFLGGASLEILSSEKDYEPVLFWLLFWNETPQGQIVSVKKFQEESTLTMPEESLDEFRQTLTALQSGLPLPSTRLRI